MSNVAGAPMPAIERNSFDGAHYRDIDAELTKGFNLPEMRVIGPNASLEFRADAYNVFNETNLAGTPTTNITSTQFGFYTGALGSRTIQLQTRFSFWLQK